MEATGKLSKQLAAFIRDNYQFFCSYDVVKVYYDNGQVEVTRILSSVFNALLSNIEVKAEYDALQPEYDLIQAMIDARTSQNMTQKELSEITGITQADISRIENGTRNPSLAMVKRIAAGLGMQLRLEFVPTTAKR